MRKTNVKKHIRRTKKGRVQVRYHKRSVKDKKYPRYVTKRKKGYWKIVKKSPEELAEAKALGLKEPEDEMIFVEDPQGQDMSELTKKEKIKESTLIEDVAKALLSPRPLPEDKDKIVDGVYIKGRKVKDPNKFVALPTSYDELEAKEAKVAELTSELNNVINSLKFDTDARMQQRKKADLVKKEADYGEIETLEETWRKRKERTEAKKEELETELAKVSKEMKELRDSIEKMEEKIDEFEKKPNLKGKEGKDD